MDKRTKINLEYVINASPKLLYNRISTPSGLAEWFADDVNLDGKIFTFFWDKQEQKAELLAKKKDTYAKFRWLDDKDTSYFFEFRIVHDDLTGDVSLNITDFAEIDEEEDLIDLWDKQISFLKRALGAF